MSEKERTVIVLCRREELLDGLTFFATNEATVRRFNTFLNTLLATRDDMMIEGSAEVQAELL